VVCAYQTAGFRLMNAKLRTYRSEDILSYIQVGSKIHPYISYIYRCLYV
jgi:hypothetical protein